jgi:hypothetical protein
MGKLFRNAERQPKRINMPDSFTNEELRMMGQLEEQRPLAAAQRYAAVWTVHTPTGPTDACEAHADKIQVLMSFLGAYTNKTPAPEGAQCANCINEAKRHNADIRRVTPDSAQPKP